jgi:hypothetical protein
MKIRKLARNSSGQALVETALILPLLMIIVLNVINFGYFFLVALNLTASPRSAVEYAILGFQTPGSQSLPPAVPVSYLGGQDLYGAISSPSSVSIQVCSSKVGVSGSNCAPCTLASDMSATCTAGGTGSPAPSSDPESPTFVLARVDVDYSFHPIIPGTPFGLALLPLGVCSSSGTTVTCRFHRQVSMREMN